MVDGCLVARVVVRIMRNRWMGAFMTDGYLRPALNLVAARAWRCLLLGLVALSFLEVWWYGLGHKIEN